jgi:sigma-B regulation protein RsbU (phosphoserine phosphatase)
MASVPTLADQIGSLSPSTDLTEDLLKLQKASHRISSLLDLDQLIDRIVNEIACSFGLVEANVYLYEPGREELVLACVHGCTLYEKGHCLKLGKEGLVGYVASTGQMRYAPDVREDPYYLPCEPSTLSEVAIPLLVENQLVGVFTASHPELNAFPPQQLKILQTLCSHIAIALQNARLFQQVRDEREEMNRDALEARAIQQALLPKSSPFIPGFAVSGLSVPAGAVGGDWFDFIPMKEGCWGLALADVSGKGTAAALLMAATRGVLRTLAEASCTPSEVLSKLNRLLVEDLPPARFVTMVFAVLDPAARTLTFASAGHLQPLLIERNEGGQEARFLHSEIGLPLGLGPGEYSETEIQLTPGSRVVFYSDGITEATNPDEEEYGQLRLKEHLLHPGSCGQPGSCGESLLADVRAFANGAGLHDDATVITVKMLG